MNVAFIPVRGGSKSIPLKNIRPMCGKPLVYWVVRAACNCNEIDRVYVATDSSVIRDAVNMFEFENLEVVDRSEASASDDATTEFAMLEFADRFDFDNIALIQATSPLLSEKDLNEGFSAFYNDGVDSVLSVVRQKRFAWSMDPDGFAEPVNYDVFARPRRQDFDGFYVENGAFYITSRNGLLESRNRISGSIAAVPMSEDSYFEIDEPEDWVIVESLLKRQINENSKTEAHQVRMFLTDCDGCLTDGGMYYTENGDEIKRFDTRDGMGIQLLRDAGVKCGIITSENRCLNKRRAEKMKIDYLVQGCKDKAGALVDICEREGISLSSVAYMGDDLNDLEVIRRIVAAGGIAACPADAIGAVRLAVSYVCVHNGGHGAVREFANYLRANHSN